MATYEELKKNQDAKRIFEELKSDGSRLLKEGKIDAKTYYAKTRQAGIELGIIGENDYPGRLPKWVEPTLEIIGGTAGFIGGTILSGGNPLVGAAAAGGGSASASLAVDYLGDLLAPDMPSPSGKQRIADAALTGTIDTALTAALPVVGKAASSGIRSAIQGGRNIKDKATGLLSQNTPSVEQSTGLISRSMGITDEAAENARILGNEGIELSLGQASTSPFLQGAYNLSSRMPLAGRPGQQQLAQSYEQVERALGRRVGPSARRAPMSESDRSTLIQNKGLESFSDARGIYKAVYDKADELSKAKGEFFDTTQLARLGTSLRPKSRYTDAPDDVMDLLGELRLYKPNFVTGRRGVTERMATLAGTKKLSFDDVKALDTKLKDMAKKYDPAKSDTPNNYAYNTLVNISDTIKRQLRDPRDTAGKLYSSGDDLFRRYMRDVENKTGREFQSAFGRGAIRPGVGRPPTKRIEELYANTFGTAKKPGDIRELKKIVGRDDMNRITANYLDDMFNKYIRGERKDFDGLFKEFGFDNVRGLQYEATEELLKDYTFTSAKDLKALLTALKQFPEVLPEVNTFVQRSGILRAAQGVGPGAFAGMAGANMSGGPAGAAAGLTLMYALNRFLARPFNRNLIDDAIKNKPGAMKEFVERFKNALPDLPNVSTGGLAAQPLTPIVEDELTAN